MKKNQNLGYLLSMLELAMPYNDVYSLVGIITQIRDISIKKANEITKRVLGSNISNTDLILKLVGFLLNEKDRIFWLQTILNAGRYDDEIISIIQSCVSEDEQPELIERLRENSLNGCHHFGWYGFGSVYIRICQQLKYEPSIEEIDVVLNNTKKSKNFDVYGASKLSEILSEENRIYFLEEYLHLILCHSRKYDSYFEDNVNNMKKLLGRELNKEEIVLFIAKLIKQEKYHDAAKKINTNIVNQKAKNIFFKKLALRSLQYDLCPELKDFLFSKDGSRTLAKIVLKRYEEDLRQRNYTAHTFDLYEEVISRGILDDLSVARILHMYGYVDSGCFAKMINILPANTKSSIIKNLVGFLAIEGKEGYVSKIKNIVYSQNVRINVNKEFQKYFKFFKI